MTYMYHSKEIFKRKATTPRPRYSDDYDYEYYEDTDFVPSTNRRSDTVASPSSSVSDTPNHQITPLNTFQLVIAKLLHQEKWYVTLIFIIYYYFDFKSSPL